MNFEQLPLLFDTIQQGEPKSDVKPALVPEEEFEAYNRINRSDVPTVNDILKLMEKASYKVSAHEFLSDVFECGAIAISNRFDFAHAGKREEQYLATMKKHKHDVRELIAEVFGKIFALLTMAQNPSIGFNDYLGELYMRSETSNSRAGQFFTPYCVSKLSAEVTIDEKQIMKAIENDEIITMNEPACGSGGMMIAAADILYNKYRFNISRNLFVECSDIDSRCVHMAFLQLGLAGIPAVIYKRDTLSMQTWERWETPAYIMQRYRFKNCLK